MSGSDSGNPGAWRVYALIGAMTILWSINFVIAKFALREMPALLAFGIRTSLAALFILPFYLVRGGRSVTARDLVPVAVLGMVGVVLNQMLFILGLSRTSVAHAALIIGLTPILVLLMAWAVGQEKIGFVEFGGMLIALAGIAVLQFSQDTRGAGSFLGDVFVFLAAVTFAVFAIQGKRVRERFDGLTLNTVAYVGGALALAPVTVYQASAFPLQSVSWKGWTSILFMAVFPSVICYLIFYHVLRYVSASRVAAFSYLQPLIAGLLAVPMLGEQLSSNLVAGGALVLLGVFLSERA